jgi:diguanylate cyclase (GGDEF)-like protein
VATLNDRLGRDHHILAVLAVLALVLAAGLTAGFIVVTAAQAVDVAALEHQRQRLFANLAGVRHVRDDEAIAAIGRSIGLDGLVWLDHDLAARPAASLALEVADGRPAGILAWRPDRPGARFLAAARAGFAAAGSLLLLLGFVVLWLARTGMSRIAVESARAESLARCDHLTGLANRRVFNRRITELLGRVVAGGGEELALLAIDLDRFKALNDRFGHVAGDEALAEVARRLRSVAPAMATLARLGGDEFAVLVPGIGPDAALALANRTAAAVAEPYRMANGMVARLGASIGIACAPGHGVGADDLIRRADIALYEAKDGGRSFALLFDPAMEARAAARALRGHIQPYLSTRPGRSTIAP